MIDKDLYNESQMVFNAKEKNKELWRRISSDASFSARIGKYCGPETTDHFLCLLYSIHLYLEAKGGNTAETMREYLNTILQYYHEGKTYDYHIVNAATLKLEGGDPRPLIFSNYAYSPRYSSDCKDKIKFDRDLLLCIAMIHQFPDILRDMISEWKHF